MKDAKKSTAGAPRRRRPPKYGGDRQIIGARLAPGLYQALVNASAANRTSISAEVERRLERSFKRDPAHMEDALQELGRHILASFEAGGRLENPELPAKEWMKNSVSYNRAIMRAFEAMLDKHPKPIYGEALQLICAIRARLEQAWLGLA